MKRYFFLLIIISAVLVVSVQGLALDFQNPSDFSEQVSCVYIGEPNTCQWSHNATGANNYVYLQSVGAYFSSDSGIISRTPLSMSYSAATVTGGFDTRGYPAVRIDFFDESMNDMGFVWAVQPSPFAYRRLEVFIQGDKATLYLDGTEQMNITGIDPYPSYIAWYSAPSGASSTAGIGLDDVIWGSTTPRYVFDMPETGYFLMKDILNSDASGFYRVNQTDPNGTPTQVHATYFISSFSKNNGNNETVTLESPTGGTQLTYSTETAYAGEIRWNLTQFFNQNPPYGLYTTVIDPQTGSPGFAQGDYIPYIGSGANIRFDKNSYAVGETAVLTVTISDAYYDEVTSPHVTIMDVFGTEVTDDTTISFTELPSHDWQGISTYTWTDDNDEGVYYGMIYATHDSEDTLMNYDTADLNSNLIVNGYVFDAETASVIPNATVNVTQGVTTDSLTTAADGNYSSTSSFSANTPTTIVASMAGYETYQHVFTPLYAGTIQINLTLMPTSPTYTGIALGGIARTPPYNRTINSATVQIQNTTDGHYYTATTNSVGYYIQNNMVGASHWFNVWGSKTGFANSTVYQKLVVGS